MNISGPTNYAQLDSVDNRVNCFSFNPLDAGKNTGKGTGKSEDKMGRKFLVGHEEAFTHNFCAVFPAGCAQVAASPGAKQAYSTPGIGYLRAKYA